MIVFILWMGCSPKKPNATSNCTNLTSALYDIATAENPSAAAKEKGVLVNESQIRVMITLRPDHSPFWVAPAKTELSIGARHQVLIAPEQLCTISSDARVLSVTAPKIPSSKK